MKITSTDFDTRDGFAWIVLENAGKEYTIQACLTELKKCADEETRYQLVKDGKPLYKKEINKFDDGMSDGICGDTNEAAFEMFGAEAMTAMFYREMRKIGVKIS